MSEHQDDTSLLEYFIAGLVVLSFGLIYLFINHGSTPLDGRWHADSAAPRLAGISPGTDGLLTGSRTGWPGSLTAQDEGRQSAITDTPPTETAATDNTGNTAMAGPPDNRSELARLRNTSTDLQKQQQDLAAQLKQGQSALAQEQSARLKAEQEIERLKDLTEQLQTRLPAAGPATAATVPGATEARLQTQQQALEQLRTELEQLKQAGNTAAASATPQMAMVEPASTETAPDARLPSRFEQELQQALDEYHTNSPIIFDRVDFRTGSAQLQPEAGQQLDITANLLREYPDIGILIRGHTDNTGPDTINTLLSLMRSDAIRQELIRRGIPDEQVRIEGVGPLEPIASNATEAGRQQNRRVELIIPE
ncbi:MAG: OmpA family protein [Thiothrix sp.]|nr:OmpA family protein [Thiothrix sp.]HPQ96832.1 OmpA family protein [Thiolinea sp.]